VKKAKLIDLGGCIFWGKISSQMITATYIFCPTVILFTSSFGFKFNRILPNLGSNLFKEGVGIEFMDFYAFVILII